MASSVENMMNTLLQLIIGHAAGKLVALPLYSTNLAPLYLGCVWSNPYMKLMDFRGTPVSEVTRYQVTCRKSLWSRGDDWGG